MPTLFALLASRIALLEQEGLYRYKPELVPTAVPQYGTLASLYAPSAPFATVATDGLWRQPVG